MNLPELAVGSLSAVALSALTLLVALGALLASWRQARRSARERHRLDAVQREIQVFAEASTRVADSLDRLLRGEVETAAPQDRVASSRRYLLLQARERLERGEDIATLSVSLGLCDDERRLLEFFERSGRFVEQVRVA